MSDLLTGFNVWLPLLLSGIHDLDIEKLLSVIASLIFVGAFVLQFFSIYRHGGREAVVSMMTWVLVASLCSALAGYYWQQQRDFFQVILLLILSAGALSCFLISALSRKTLEQEIQRRKIEDAPANHQLEAEIANTASTMRHRLAQARQRKTS